MIWRINHYRYSSFSERKQELIKKMDPELFGTEKFLFFAMDEKMK
jgi:hypothetical protein